MESKARNRLLSILTPCIESAAHRMAGHGAFLA